MKKKISTGQFISMIGTLILCAGLVCSGLELVSLTAFRAIIAVGIIVQVAALVFILKRKEL